MKKTRLGEVVTQKQATSKTANLKSNSAGPELVPLKRTRSIERRAEGKVLRFKRKINQQIITKNNQANSNIVADVQAISTQYTNEDLTLFSDQEENKIEPSKENSVVSPKNQQKPDLQSKDITKNSDKVLKFGFKFVQSLKKGYGTKIRKTVFNTITKEVILQTDKSVMVFDFKTGLQKRYFVLPDETKSQLIASMFYVQRYMLYFVISTDFKIHVFNELMVCIKQFALNVSHVYRSEYIEEYGIFLTAGVEGCYIYKLECDGQMSPENVINLDPLGQRLNIKLSLVKKLEEAPNWVKGLRIDMTEKMIYTWSQQKIALFDLLKGNLITVSDQMIPPDTQAIDLLYMSKFRYLVFGATDQEIKVFRIVPGNPYVTKFKGHDGQITALIRHPNRENQFISAGQDSTLRIWCLDKFSCQYIFKLGEQFQHIELKQDHFFVCHSSHNLVKIGKLLDIAYLYHHSQTEAVNLGACFFNMQAKLENKPYAIYALYKDNSVKFLAPHSIQDTRVLSTIFPPPGADIVSQIKFCSLLKRMLVLQKSGQISVYKIEKDTATLELLVEPGTLADRKGKFIKDKIVCMELTCRKVPKFDCNDQYEDIGNLQKQNKVQDANQTSQMSENVATMLSKTGPRFQQGQELPYSHGNEGNEEKKRKGFLIHEVAKQISSRRNESTERSLSSDSLLEDLTYSEDQFVMFGMSGGHILVYQVKNLKSIVGRFSVMRGDILFIRELQNLEAYIAIDSLHNLQMFNLTPRGIELLHSVILFRPVFDIQLYKRYVYIAFESGDLELLYISKIDKELSQLKKVRHRYKRTKWTKELGVSSAFVKKLQKTETIGESLTIVRFLVSKKDDHDSKITSINIDQATGCMVTADVEGKVKVWNKSKELLHEIQFPEEIKAAHFIGASLDLLVAHGTNISLILTKTYLKKSPESSKLMFLWQSCQELTNCLTYQLMVKDKMNSEDGAQNFEKDEKFVQKLNFILMTSPVKKIYSERDEEEQEISSITESDFSDQDLIPKEVLQNQTSAKKQVKIAEQKLQKNEESTNVNQLQVYQPNQVAQRKTQINPQPIVKEQSRPNTEQIRRQSTRKQQRPQTSKQQIYQNKVQTSTNSSEAPSGRQVLQSFPKQIFHESLIAAQQAVALLENGPKKKNKLQEMSQNSKTLHIQGPAKKMGHATHRIQKSQDMINTGDSKSTCTPILTKTSPKQLDTSVSKSKGTALRFRNLRPAQRTALPREWIQSKYQLIQDGKLHPKKNKHFTRRDLTEIQIQRNILDHNQTALQRDTSSLFLLSTNKTPAQRKYNDSVQLIKIKPKYVNTEGNLVQEEKYKILERLNTNAQNFSNNFSRDRNAQKYRTQNQTVTKNQSVKQQIHSLQSFRNKSHDRGMVLMEEATSSPSMLSKFLADNDPEIIVKSVQKPSKNSSNQYQKVQEQLQRLQTDSFDHKEDTKDHMPLDSFRINQLYPQTANHKKSTSDGGGGPNTGRTSLHTVKKKSHTIEQSQNFGQNQLPIVDPIAEKSASSDESQANRTTVNMQGSSTEGFITNQKTKTNTTSGPFFRSQLKSTSALPYIDLNNTQVQNVRNEFSDNHSSFNKSIDKSSEKYRITADQSVKEKSGSASSTQHINSRLQTVVSGQKSAKLRWQAKSIYHKSFMADHRGIQYQRATMAKGLNQNQTLQNGLGNKNLQESQQQIGTNQPLAKSLQALRIDNISLKKQQTIQAESRIRQLGSKSPQIPLYQNLNQDEIKQNQVNLTVGGMFSSAKSTQRVDEQDESSRRMLFQISSIPIFVGKKINSGSSNFRRSKQESASQEKDNKKQKFKTEHKLMKKPSETETIDKDGSILTAPSEKRSLLVIKSNVGSSLHKVYNPNIFESNQVQRVNSDHLSKHTQEAEEIDPTLSNTLANNTDFYKPADHTSTKQNEDQDQIQQEFQALTVATKAKKGAEIHNQNPYLNQQSSQQVQNTRSTNPLLIRPLTVQSSQSQPNGTSAATAAGQRNRVINYSAVVRNNRGSNYRTTYGTQQQRPLVQKSQQLKTNKSLPKNPDIITNTYFHQQSYNSVDKSGDKSDPASTNYNNLQI